MSLLYSSSLVALCFYSLLSLAISTQPNILFVLTDDQDWHMESMKYMPFLQKYLINEGTVFSNHYCTVALCCPSRVNLWTGRAAHNTNVTDVFPPYGGFPKVVKEGINDDYLPIWMQEAGYNTYYTGKLWNAHDVENYNSPFAGGYNGSNFILDPFTYEYYNATMTLNGGKPVNYAGQYSPDLTAESAYSFLDEATAEDKPFFLTVAPVAPHGNIRLEPFETDMPRYAPRHAHLFKDYKIPRDENFNPEKQSGIGWVADLPRLNDTVIAYNDEYQRARLRSLQSVDEMLEVLVEKLEAKGILDNTYIFYTTDNGYHISQHRMHPGKECGFDTDIHIPLIVRGPGIAPGRILDAVTTHTDLAPTILKLSGQTRNDFDGAPIPLTREDATVARTEHVNAEFWGLAIPEGIYGYHGKVGFKDGFANAHRNNTYKAIRVIGEDYNLYYNVLCTNEREFYDVKADPGQVHNLLSKEEHASNFNLDGRTLEQVISRLDALIMVLKSCKGLDCIEPWRVLHPRGDVSSLKDSLRYDLDAFYYAQPKVAFTACELGYIRESEGPQHANVFNDVDSELRRDDGAVDANQQKVLYRGPWSIWT